jgi:hypothetical protein
VTLRSGMPAEPRIPPEEPALPSRPVSRLSQPAIVLRKEGKGGEGKRGVCGRGWAGWCETGWWAKEWGERERDTREVMGDAGGWERRGVKEGGKKGRAAERKPMLVVGEEKAERKGGSGSFAQIDICSRMRKL